MSTHSEAANKALIRRWFEEVWNQGRAELIDELRNPDATATGLSLGDPESRGNEPFKNFYFNLREAFPDLHATIDDVLAEGDKVAVRLTFEGSHIGHSLDVAPSQRKVRFQCIAIAQCANGKISNAWNSIDHLGILEQVGAVPKSVFGRDFISVRKGAPQHRAAAVEKLSDS